MNTTENINTLCYNSICEFNNLTYLKINGLIQI